MKLSTAIATGVGTLTFGGLVLGLAGEVQTVRQQAELGAEAAVRVEATERKLERLEDTQRRQEWMTYQIMRRVAPEAAEMIPEPGRPGRAP